MLLFHSPTVHLIHAVDFRNPREPCRQLRGQKAVVYLEFLDDNSILSMSLRYNLSIVSNKQATLFGVALLFPTLSDQVTSCALMVSAGLAIGTSFSLALFTGICYSVFFTDFSESSHGLLFSCYIRNEPLILSFLFSFLTSVTQTQSCCNDDWCGNNTSALSLPQEYYDYIQLGSPTQAKSVRKEKKLIRQDDRPQKMVNPPAHTQRLYIYVVQFFLPVPGLYSTACCK